MQGLIMHTRNNHNDNQYPDTPERFVMNGIEWLTLAKAADEPTCLVTAETLRQMIKAGKVSEGRFMVVPYGKKVIYYIDKSVLPELPYQTQGRKPKDRKS
jgi:hypothetical protein